MKKGKEEGPDCRETQEENVQWIQFYWTTVTSRLFSSYNYGVGVAMQEVVRERAWHRLVCRPDPRGGPHRVPCGRLCHLRSRFTASGGSNRK